MPSPFPGMDPCLESPEFWPGFHARFVNYWCEALAEHLPGHYQARIDERVMLETGKHPRQAGPPRYRRHPRAGGGH